MSGGGGGRTIITKLLRTDFDPASVSLPLLSLFASPSRYTELSSKAETLLVPILRALPFFLLLLLKKMFLLVSLQPTQFADVNIFVTGLNLRYIKEL